MAKIFSLTKLVLIVFIAITYSSCFGGGLDIQGSVKKYRDGLVYTEGGGRFRIGKPSEEWLRKYLSIKAVVFENSHLNASLSVDSFCLNSVSDGPLKILANQLFYGMTDQKRLSTNPVVVDERVALRNTRSGMLDGASIVMDVVVLKMNFCVFDFVYVASPDDYEQGVLDFERFYHGFKYLKGPGFKKEE